jgi:chemotaxis protein MotB
VADREPYQGASDPYDPRNRRMSITLAWTQGGADDSAVRAMHTQLGGAAPAGESPANGPAEDDAPTAMHGFRHP